MEESGNMVLFQQDLVTSRVEFRREIDAKICYGGHIRLAGVKGYIEPQKILCLGEPVDTELWEL